MPVGYGAGGHNGGLVMTVVTRFWAWQVRWRTMHRVAGPV